MIELGFGLIFLLNVGACLLDIDYHLIRGGVSESGQTTLLGVSSWVQYQSRICTMLSVVLMTYMFESAGMDLNIYRLIGVIYLGSWVIGLIYLKSSNVHRFISFIVLSGTTLVFRGFARKKIWYTTLYSRDKAFAYGFLLYTMFGFAVIAPFIFAKNYPNLRMTFALSAQLLNFGGSILAFTAVEPRYFKSLDSRKERNISMALAMSRLYSLFFVSIALIII